jgi:hypothetical protein
MSLLISIPMFLNFSFLKDYFKRKPLLSKEQLTVVTILFIMIKRGNWHVFLQAVLLVAKDIRHNNKARKITMKKNNHVVLIFIILTTLFFTLSCGGRLRVIPEISPSLFGDDILDLTGKPLTETIIKYKSELILVTREGNILRWNPTAKIINFLYNINAPLDPESKPLHWGNFLLLNLKQNNTRTFLIFDLEQMKETCRLNLEQVTRVIGFDHKLLVYMTLTNDLVFYNYRTRKRLKSVAMNVHPTIKQGKSKEDVFNCAFLGDKVLVLSNSRLITFQPSQNTITNSELKYNASSGFLADGNYIYYGSIDRELVKLSMKGKKTSWRFQLANRLRIAPVKVGPYITIIPEDNNLYFFTTGGSLYWWDKLNSTKLMPQLAMKENAAVFMWDNNLKFFNYKKKQVITYTLRDWMSIKTNPVAFGEYIYFVMEEQLEENVDEEKTQRSPYQILSKIGNNYGVEVKAKPEYVWPKGKSILFTLKEFNLHKPQYTIQIYKPNPNNATIINTPIFEKIIMPKDKPTFVWLPEEALEYKMMIKIDALNKQNVVVEETLKIIDLNRVLQNHYYEIQRSNENDKHSAYSTGK